MIPVIDLLGGCVVHAVKGERKHYQPVTSVLCDTPDPLAVARAFRDNLGLSEIYVADLDAIQSSGQISHSEIIAALASEEKLNLILDIGVSDVQSIRAWLYRSAHKMIVGSETLHTWNVLRTLPAEIDEDRLVFSLDLRAGKIVSRCPVLSSMSPIEALEHLQAFGWREVIVLDLARVGSSEGIDRVLVAEARANLPHLNLLVGGGIAAPEEVVELKSLGIAGVLIASALHSGAITERHLSVLRRKMSD